MRPPVTTSAERPAAPPRSARRPPPAEERDERLRSVLTPEGVALSLRRAGLGQRFAAVVVDLIIVTLLLVIPGIAIAVGVGALDMPRVAAGWSITALLIASFLLRTFYFAAFELRWQGRTPGKRWLRIRVIERHGRPLTAGAVFARNLAREAELFLPLSLLAAGGSAGVDGWIRLATLAWLGLFLAMPLFNRDRLRVGDLIGGTIVIANPKAVLLDDIADDAKTGSGQAAERFRFTPVQLQTYGIYELQVLEEVLRLPEGPVALDTRRAVAEKIRQRIGWGAGDAQAPEGDREADPRPFLEAYYAALRGNLETGLLFGRRRQRQAAKGPVPPSP